ncbi:N-acyl homoserine lactonase [subsurface metagenome]
MAVRELFLFPGGTLEVEKSLISYRLHFGIKERIPVVMALIKTDDGNILFDVGLDPDGLRDPQRTWGIKAEHVVCFERKEEIRSYLQQLNLTPKDIEYVIISHLHWDHCGALRFFKDSSIIIQKSEYRFAFYPDSFVAPIYIREHFDHPLDYKLIEGDAQIVPGVHVIHTPGHTPGHQSLMLKLPQEGTIILAADAIFMEENIEKDTPSSNAWSPDLAMNSMHRIQSLALWEGACLIPGHEPKLWARTKSWPESFK